MHKDWSGFREKCATWRRREMDREWDAGGRGVCQLRGEGRGAGERWRGDGLLNGRLGFGWLCGRDVPSLSLRKEGNGGRRKEGGEWGKRQRDRKRLRKGAKGCQTAHVRTRHLYTRPHTTGSPSRRRRWLVETRRISGDPPLQHVARPAGPLTFFQGDFATEPPGGRAHFRPKTCKAVPFEVKLPFYVKGGTRHVAAFGRIKLGEYASFSPDKPCENFAETSADGTRVKKRPL